MGDLEVSGIALRKVHVGMEGSIGPVLLKSWDCTRGNDRPGTLRSLVGRYHFELPYQSFFILYFNLRMVLDALYMHLLAQLPW